MRFNPRDGFTLVEMLVTVVIMAVLLGVTAPRLLVSDQRRVGMEAEQLLRQLERARTRSMARRAVVRVSFDTGAKPGYKAYEDDNEDDVIGETTAEAMRFVEFGSIELTRSVAFGRGSVPAFPGDLSSDPITLPAEWVEFDRRGLTVPLGTRGIIYLHSTRDPSIAAAVMVSGSGSFRVWTYADGAWS